MGRQAGRLTPRHTEHSASDSGSVSAHRKHITIGPEQDNAQYKRNKLEQDNVPQHKRNKLKQKMCHSNFATVPAKTLHSLSEVCFRISESSISTAKLRFGARSVKTLNGQAEVCHYISEALRGQIEVCHCISEALHGQIEVCHCISEALHGQIEVCHCISESSPWPN